MRATAPRLTYRYEQTPVYWERSIYCALPVPRVLPWEPRPTWPPDDLWRWRNAYQP